MKNIWLLVVLTLAYAWYACNEKKVPEFTGYDIFLIAGQSNAFNGRPQRPETAPWDLRILQLGRHGNMNYRLLLAIDPLHHHQQPDSLVGFAWTFARLYADAYLEPGRKVLLVPAASNASGFLNGQWNRGNPLFRDAVERVNHCLKTYPGSRMKAILWHQGESDVSFGTGYQNALDAMIANMRLALHAENNTTIPFIAGGLVPYWTEVNPRFKVIDSILRALPARLPRTGFADPRLPFVIKKPNDAFDAIHFDADGQREMGRRYFEVYKNLL